ncbi:MAG TPA: hypothetical protein VHD38_02290 [Candidatus Paceibacterota bacterium]|nr:hypothetical protein [Candidatus Paceibacterota bacterium]
MFSSFERVLVMRDGREVFVLATQVTESDVFKYGETWCRATFVDRRIDDLDHDDVFRYCGHWYRVDLTGSRLMAFPLTPDMFFGESDLSQRELGVARSTKVEHLGMEIVAAKRSAK